ncbi:MAG: ROK family protein [Sphingobacteriaceae bacterium]
MATKKYTYSKKLLKHLYFSKMLSCADLSLKISRSVPSTTVILNELIKEGRVIEMGFAPSTGGRRALMYSLNPATIYLVSVAMNQRMTRLVILDANNQYISLVKTLELSLSNDRACLDVLIANINLLIQDADLDKSKILGIGIGMPGFVDAQKSLNYSFIDTHGKSISEIISEQTDLPVFIDNDSRLIALAELRFGAARDRSTAMVININWGVGLGLILNRGLFKGYNGFAGEFSHLPLFSNGKLCTCGKRGCLETEASLVAVVEKAREGLKAGRMSVLKFLQTVDLEEETTAIIQAAANGDQFAVELISEAGYNIGRGVAILIHLLNPEIIILSGRGSLAGKLWQAPIQQALNEHCIPRLAGNTGIEISTLGNEAELLGGAALVMENIEKITNRKIS